MKIFNAYGNSIAVSIIVCVLLFDVIGIPFAPLWTLFTFLVLIHFFTLLLIVFKIISNDKLLSDFKNSFNVVLPQTIRAIIISLVLALIIYIGIYPKIDIFFKFFGVGLFYGVMRGLTYKNTNSVYWLAIVMLFAITSIIIGSLFIFNIELALLILVIMGGEATQCKNCGTWWSQILMNQTVLKEDHKPKTGTITRRVRGWGTGADTGRRFEMEYNESYTYYITTRLYREDLCCEVCGHQSSKEVSKRKNLFGWTAFYF